MPQPAPITRRHVVSRAIDFPILKAYVDDNGARVIEGIATTPSVDLAGDSINPLGVKFRLPVKLLWQHDPTKPIGNVVSADVTPAGIKVRAQLCAPGEIGAIDQHWSEIVNNLVDGLSIGFKANKPPKATKTGYHYDDVQWLELSCVTIAANQDCRITHIKAFEIEAAEESPPLDPAGDSAANPAPIIKAAAMTVKEQLAACKARLADARARLAHLGELSTDNVKDFETINAEIETEVRQRELLVRALRNASDNAEPVQATGTDGVPAQRQSVAAPAIIRSPLRQIEKERPKAQLLFRACAVHVMSYAHRSANDAVALQLYPGDELLKAYLLQQKAAVEPALTTVPAWAGELVRETWAEFLDLLQPESVYARLAALGARFTFGQSGKIHYPARAATPNLAGDFVGENAPIPVKKGALTSSSLTPKKLAVISAFSQEMSTATGGQIEDYIRQFMIEDTAKVLDTRLLDNVAASAIRPAGLLNGVTLTPSSGATFANIITDIKAAMTPILGVQGGRRLVWIMNPLQAMSLGLVTNAAGAFVFPTANTSFIGYTVIVSANVPAGTMILVDAADFVTAANDTPQFVVSNEATLHMEDTTPEPINDGTPATPVISLYQQDAFAVRMIQQMNWAMRRPGMVSGISGITW